MKSTGRMCVALLAGVDRNWAEATGEVSLRKVLRTFVRKAAPIAEQADQLDRTDPNWMWDAIYKRYDGDPRRIIEAAGRSRAFDLGD